MKLTYKQQRFVDFYQGNATEAAVKAGYSSHTAPFIGAENLKKPQIYQAIQNRTQKNVTLKIGSREELQAFWTTVYNDTTVSMNDRLRASELLGKSQAAFTERVEVEHKGEVTVKHEAIEERLSCFFPN